MFVIAPATFIGSDIRGSYGAEGNRLHGGRVSLRGVISCPLSTFLQGVCAHLYEAAEVHGPRTRIPESDGSGSSRSAKSHVPLAPVELVAKNPRSLASSFDKQEQPVAISVPPGLRMLDGRRAQRIDYNFRDAARPVPCSVPFINRLRGRTRADDIIL